MSKIPEPAFPIFTWDEYFWITTARLPSWSGCESRNGHGGKSVGEIVGFCFAPENRGDEPLNEDEISLVQWIIDHEEAIHGSMLQGLFKNYPSIRGEVLDYIDEDEVDELLPAIGTPKDFDKHIGIHGINVHQIDDGAAPYFGIELWCPWDDDHTQGILMHGTDVLEVGDVDVACTLSIAEKYANKNQT